MSNVIVESVTKAVNKVGFGLRKHSPEILMAAGVVGTVASTIIACKATTKVNGILEDSKIQVESVHKVLDDESISEETYSEEDSKKDLAIIYVQTGVKLVKLYAPAVGLGVLSIVSMLASNNILRKRNVALAAAYTVVDGAFKEYRGRVVERFGKDIDRELRYNLTSKKVTRVIEDEEGKEKKVKETIQVRNDDRPYIGYARVFDAGNPGWENDAMLNQAFLKAQQNFANQKLQAQGYLFLNDVYKMLGYREDLASRNVGWIYDENNEIGDNFVDFGFMDDAAFMSGMEPTVILDFNVDGPIMERFEKAYRGWAVC